MAAASSFWIYLKNWISWAENFIIGFPFYRLGFPAKRKNSFAKIILFAREKCKNFFFLREISLHSVSRKNAKFSRNNKCENFAKKCDNFAEKNAKISRKNGIFYKNAKLCAYTYVCYRWILPPLKMGFPEYRDWKLQTSMLPEQFTLTVLSWN